MNTNMATINNHNTESFLNEKQTVLIVDDSKVIRLALNKILKNDFIVLQANDGEDAWEKLQENDAVSAIFSDVSMPNLDGFGLLERVRTSTAARIAELPFIIITANDDDADFSAKVSNAGGNALITKPFKTDEIKTCIQKHIASELTNQAVPPVNTPAMPDHEAAEILGIDDIESADKPESTSSAVAEHDMGFTIDENFFSNSREASSPESRDEPTIEASLEHENLSPVSDDDLSSMADMDFSFDENILNETLDNNNSTVDEFEFTIDEEFLNRNLESAHTETGSEVKAHNTDTTTNPTTDWSEPSFSEDEFNLTEETPAPSSPKVELSLEPAIPSNKHKDMLESEAEKEDNTPLEQARRHAMEVAREKVQPQQNTVDTKVQHTTEREQIRARLQQIREQEKLDLANARSARRGTQGNSTSLFSKLGRIISGLFGFRKK